MSSVVFNFLFQLCGRLGPLSSSRNFKKHNRLAFSHKSRQEKKKAVILFELNDMCSAHISYSYLAHVLADRSGAEIVGYLPRSPQNFKQKILFELKQAAGFGTFGIYRSFGANAFWDVSAARAQSQEAKLLATKIISELHTLEHLDALTVNEIKIGDLIYDTYLKRNSVPTIDIKSGSFFRHLTESLELFVAWNKYFDTHDVQAINVSHCVYNLALPLRIAARRNIPAFQANATHIYRLGEKNIFAYNDFHYFPERFSTLPEDVQKIGLEEAERRIARRFGGEVGVDMAYSSKSAYGAIKERRLIRESSRKKILIATHCFFDSPHSYGANLFPDFYTWLEFLGKMTECTDYDWYIKTHPDYVPGTMEIIKRFINLYPKLTLLPSDASHHQIISEGIDLALTVYGTIGFEYAAMGIPVINASRNNPHIAYDFNLHPKNINEYRNILLNLDNLSLEIDSRQVCEYYFMRFIYNTEDIFFDDYDRCIKELGGYWKQFTPSVYDLWCREFSPEKHEKICSALRDFIDSGEFRMDYTHFGQEFSTKNIGAKS